MECAKTVRLLLVITATAGVLFPPSLWADSPSIGSTDRVVNNSSWLITDVALDQLGTLSGQFITEQGNDLVGHIVQLSQHQQLLVETVTGEHGQFRFTNLRGGVYNLQLGDHSAICRCWTYSTAPPHAASEAVLSAKDVMRGQSHPIACGLSNPWVITGIALVAVAIPVALHNHRDDRVAASQ
jgi:hypothetical protein